MSSLAVRTEITNWLNANFTAVSWYDMSFHTDLEMIAPTQRETFMLVQFAAPNETISSLGPRSCWREEGVIFLHMVEPVGGDTMATLTICDTLQRTLRGQRLGVTVVESVTPPTDVEGASIKWEGSFHGFTQILSYSADHEPFP